MRSATCVYRRQPHRGGRFNPRTPCGVRRNHPPGNNPDNRFQSTHSLRSATTMSNQINLNDGVSIHALLAECDFDVNELTQKQKRFNPRTPCGVRRKSAKVKSSTGGFQSTHSLRSATTTRTTTETLKKGFNPRTPCGVRRNHPPGNNPDNSFNPRTPCGVRPTETLKQKH